MAYFAQSMRLVLCLGIDERRDIMMTALIPRLDQAEGALERERMDSTSSKINEASTAYLARKDLPRSARLERQQMIQKLRIRKPEHDVPASSNSQRCPDAGSIPGSQIFTVTLYDQTIVLPNHDLSRSQLASSPNTSST
ncbi:hypothetical protein D6D13_08979 [Aureobasidium pullulans]|uniref:Uncharacterized protein n=1 Tax=Aureobasidium pullulans TaxID=5580 RepID=A0A4S9C469_AURPU|nr:hypothetical protein D6D13_08979 [Aureobasidium pullulans]